MTNTRVSATRERLLSDLEAYEAQVQKGAASQAKPSGAKGAALAEGGLPSTVLAVGGAGALVAGGRAALVSSRNERERLELERAAALPARRNLALGAVATALAGGALGTFFKGAGDGEATSKPNPALVAKLQQSEAARAAARAARPPG